jgi:hypothetical protein
LAKAAGNTKANKPAAAPARKTSKPVKPGKPATKAKAKPAGKKKK